MRWGRFLVVAVAALSACSTTNPKVAPGSPAQSAAPQQMAPVPRQAPRAAAPVAAAPSDRSVFYDFDKSNIKPTAESTIEANAKYLRAHPSIKIRVEGNTDERGSPEYNLALGQRRADGVAKDLALLGISPDRIEAVSFGEEKPKAPGHDEAAWAENRRADIVYP